MPGLCIGDGFYVAFALANNINAYMILYSHTLTVSLSMVSVISERLVVTLLHAH